MKFSVGDKVRVTHVGEEYYAHLGMGRIPAGTLGTIVEQRPDYLQGDMPGFGVVYECVSKTKFSPETAWNVYFENLELVAPVAPRFKVGDRVKVVKNTRSLCYDYTIGFVGVVTDVYSGERYRVDFGDDGVFYCYHGEVAPYTPRHVFAASQASHIDDETIDRWVDEGVENVEAQKTLNFENPSFTAKSGDALVVVENGKAYLYRLEGTTDVE